MPDTPQSELKDAGAMTGALLSALDQIVDRVLGKQTVDKSGKPLRQVAYMHLPNGIPIDPRDFRDPWRPSGGATLSAMREDGKLPELPTIPAPSDGTTTVPADAAPPVPVEDSKLMAAMAAALNTTWMFDDMPMVTGDGTYQPYPGTRKLSSAYEGLIHSVQTVPPPPQPPEVVKAIKAAEKVLYNLDDDGNIMDYTVRYQNWLNLSQAYADAKSDFATAEARAMRDPVFGAAWPVTAASQQQKVDNAYRMWRSSGADQVEKALDTINSQGGSAAAHFVSQARELFDRWDLSLAGIVAVKTPYTQIMPSSWYDHTNQRLGFIGISATAQDYHAKGGAQSSSFANNWYKGSAKSTQAGGKASFLGISVGGHGGSSSSASSSEGHQGGQSSSYHADRTTSATVSFEYGVINMMRPWCLTELFHIGGWYVPGEPAGCVSDGTIAGQAGNEDKLLPMITTQALVIRNVTIEATGWGEAGKALSEHHANQKANASSSSWNAGGSAGFLGFGASASHSQSTLGGSSSNDKDASWNFEHDRDYNWGRLTMRGSQIAGFVGEILGMNPRIDGGKPTDGALPSGGARSTTNGAGAATPAAPAGGKR
jgi:hypothetical protein